MQAAFFLLIFFPPPAAGALRFAHANGTRAGRAADRGKSPVMQGVVGNAVVGDIARHLARAPIGERIDFDEAVRLVEFGKRRGAPVL